MVLARSAAPFSASIADCLWHVYYFDNVCLVLSSAWWAYVQGVFGTFLHVGATCCLSDGGWRIEERSDPQSKRREPNRYVCSKDICARQNASMVSSPRRWSRRSTLTPVALGLGGGPRSLADGWFHVHLFRLFYYVFFKVVRWWLHLEVRIRFYPRFGSAYGADRGCVWRCVSSRSFGIQSIFIFDGLVSDQTLLIYGYHHCWWLLVWCISPLRLYNDDFTW
jgi:hypothetical protein